MISSAPAIANRRKLAGAAVLAFALGGLALSWVSAHATTLAPVTISAPAIPAVVRDTSANLPLQRIRITAKVKLGTATLTGGGDRKS